MSGAGRSAKAARLLRDTTPTKIIVLTGRDAITDRVEGYTSGADVYMVKPTSQAELLAAIKPLLGRAIADHSSPGSAGWSLDTTDGCLLTPKGKQIRLTLRQFEFMKRLMREPGKGVRRDELRKVIEISQKGSDSRALDMFVARLRREIEEQGNCEAQLRQCRVAVLLSVPHKPRKPREILAGLRESKHDRPVNDRSSAVSGHRCRENAELIVWRMVGGSRRRT